MDATPTLEAGGPDIYGGGSITVSGDSVDGAEGSGVVQFTGTFSSLSWTDTTENSYGFTVGEASPVSGAPEPASIALLASATAVLWFRRKGRSGPVKSLD